MDHIVLSVEILWMMGTLFVCGVAGWFGGKTLSKWCRGKSHREDDVFFMAESVIRGRTITPMQRTACEIALAGPKESKGNIDG